MEQGVGTTNNSGANISIPNFHRTHRGISGKHHQTSGNKCHLGGLTTTNKNKFSYHMNTYHRGTSTGVSRPEVTECSLRGVFTAGGVPWGSTVS